MDEIFVGFCGGVIISLAIFVIVFMPSRVSKIDAIKRGYAHSEVSAEGRTTFRWNNEVLEK